MQDVQHAPSQMPVFRSVQEEAEFWDTHSTTEFEDEWEPVEVEIAPDFKSLRLLTVTLDYSDFEQMRTLARRDGLKTSDLARSWLVKALADALAESETPALTGGSAIS